jgi:hypothetical protein
MSVQDGLRALVGLSLVLRTRVYMQSDYEAYGEGIEM